MKYTLCVFTIYCLMLLLLAVSLSAFSETSSETSGNIGFTLNQVVDDTSGGFTGEIAYTQDLFEIDIDTQLNFGDIYRAKLTADIIFDLGTIGLKVTSNHKGKGYELQTIGRESTLEAAGNFSRGDWDISFGIGGKNAAPWGAPNLFDDAKSLGYEDGVLESINAIDIYPAPRGLPAREFTALLLLASTNFDRGWVEGDIRLQSEITGKEKGHQVILHAQTSKDLGRISWTAAYEYSILYWKQRIHSETALVTGFNYPF